MTQATPDVAKIAYRVNEAIAAAGIGRTKLYELMDQGKLRTVKIGGRRLIMAVDLNAMFEAAKAEIS